MITELILNRKIIEKPETKIKIQKKNEQKQEKKNTVLKTGTNRFLL